jgi:hypothetical protein
MPSAGKGRRSRDSDFDPGRGPTEPEGSRSPGITRMGLSPGEVPLGAQDSDWIPGWVPLKIHEFGRGWDRVPERSHGGVATPNFGTPSPESLHRNGGPETMSGAEGDGCDWRDSLKPWGVPWRVTVPDPELSILVLGGRRVGVR